MSVTVKAWVEYAHAKRADPARPHASSKALTPAIIMNIIFKNLLVLLVTLNGH